MDRTLPLHIERLFHDLETGLSADQALANAVPALSKDVTLLQLYTRLGYCLQTHSFPSLPSNAQVLGLLAQEYQLPGKQPTVDHYLAHSPAIWRRMFADLDSPWIGLNYDPSHPA